MTTVIYKRGKYLAADRLATGGPDGIRSVSKLVRFDVRNSESEPIMTVNIGLSGKLLLHSVIQKTFEDHCVSKGEFNEAGLYAYEKAMLELDDSFYHVIVIQRYNSDKTITEYGYYVHDSEVGETDKGFIAAGSGSWYAYGLELALPNATPENLISRISENDAGTSKDCDVIKLKQSW